MSTEDAQVVVCDNPDEERYELLVDDRLVGEIQYHHRPFIRPDRVHPHRHRRRLRGPARLFRAP